VKKTNRLITLLNLSAGTEENMMGSIVPTSPKRTSGIYNAHTTWAHPT